MAKKLSALFAAVALIASGSFAHHNPTSFDLDEQKKFAAPCLE